MDSDYTCLLTRLILGSSRYTAETLRALGVGAVVCVAPADECPEVVPHDPSVLHFRFPAAFHIGRETSLRNLRKAVASTIELMQDGITVYLHCLEGNVRSAAVAVMVVAIIKDVTVSLAYQFVSERRLIYRRCGYLDALESRQMLEPHEELI